MTSTRADGARERARHCSRLREGKPRQKTNLLQVLKVGHRDNHPLLENIGDYRNHKHSREPAIPHGEAVVPGRESGARANERRRKRGRPKTTWRRTVEKEKQASEWRTCDEVRAKAIHRTAWRQSVEALRAT